MKTDVFSQQGLNDLLGLDQGSKNDIGNTQSVSDHPATSKDSDLTTHPALTNNFSDLSQLGKPGQLPNMTTPSTSQQNNPESQIGDTTSPENLQNMGIQISSQTMQNPLGDTTTPALDKSSTELTPNSLDPLVSNLIQLVLNNGVLSQSFCSALVDHLCQNAQFMTQLRGMLLQKLLSDTK